MPHVAFLLIAIHEKEDVDGGKADVELQGAKVGVLHMSEMLSHTGKFITVGDNKMGSQEAEREEMIHIGRPFLDFFFFLLLASVHGVLCQVSARCAPN